MRILVWIAAALISSTASAGDIEAGAELHAEHCVECHRVDNHTALYTRENRTVQSFHRLGGQVSACVQVLDLGFFPEEEDDVKAYLNATFYKFVQDQK